MRAARVVARSSLGFGLASACRPRRPQSQPRQSRSRSAQPPRLGAGRRDQAADGRPRSAELPRPRQAAQGPAARTPRPGRSPAARRCSSAESANLLMIRAAEDRAPAQERGSAGPSDLRDAAAELGAGGRGEGLPRRPGRAGGGGQRLQPLPPVVPGRHPGRPVRRRRREWRRPGRRLLNKNRPRRPNDSRHGNPGRPRGPLPIRAAPMDHADHPDPLRSRRRTRPGPRTPPGDQARQPLAPLLLVAGLVPGFIFMAAGRTSRTTGWRSSRPARDGHRAKPGGA